jgi:hypothetical protein
MPAFAIARILVYVNSNYRKLSRRLAGWIGKRNCSLFGLSFWNSPFWIWCDVIIAGPNGAGKTTFAREFRNTPPNMHCLRYFIKPDELRHMCHIHGLDVVLCRGVVPKIFHAAFWRMLATGRVDDSFTFKFTRHTTMGYVGVAIRAPGLPP